MADRVVSNTQAVAGTPVTAEIINNIILDLKTLEQSNSPDFNLTLEGAGKAVNPVTVSSNIFHKRVVVDVNPSREISGKGSVNFSKAEFKTDPKCWLQINSNGAKLTYAQLNVVLVVTSVSLTEMKFEVRSIKQTSAPAKLTIDCYATA